MSWFRVDDKSAFHRKVVRAGNASWGALCRMGAYSADHGDDGFVCLEVASMISSESELKSLMSVGLLERTDRDGGGYMIHDFLEWNPSRESLESLSKKRARAGRKGGSKRKANVGASAQSNDSAIAQSNPKQRDGLGMGSDLSLSEKEIPADPGSSTELPTERKSGTVRAAPIRNAAGDGADGMSVQAWCDGVKSVVGESQEGLAHGVQTSLVQCFVGHRRNGAGRWQGDIVECAREAGVAFAEAHKGGNLSPHAYITWENSGRPVRGPGNGYVSPVPISKPAGRKPIVTIPTPPRRANDG